MGRSEAIMQANATTAMRLLMFLVAAGLMLGVGKAHAQYRWTDANGQVHYTDKAPPPGARDVRVLGRVGVGSAADDAGFPTEVRRAMQNFPLVLYTTANCSPCVTARNYLRRKALPYSERIVQSPADFEAFKAITPENSFPVLSIGRQVIKGYQEQEWDGAIAAAGYPATGRLPQGYQAIASPLAPRPAPQAGTLAPADAPADGASTGTDTATGARP